MTLDLGITRRQRYVSNKTAANVTSSTYAQGGTITSYTYSGTTYIAHVFTASGIFTVTSDIYPLEFIAVAGGGGGGIGSPGGPYSGGGGGGGGGIVTNGSLNVINRIYASPDYQAVTTSTQANAKGGWVYTAQNPFTDFVGGGGGFLFSWSAVQQLAGGARTSIIPETGADNINSPQQYYMEIGITSIGPTDVAVALIRDGYPKDGYANMPYVNLNGGNVTAWQAAGGTALGTFAAGDTLQLAWDSGVAYSGVGTYWWVGKNNTWYSTPFVDYTNVAITTATYRANGLRVIFMCAAAGGTNLRGQFRSGNENRYTAPSNGNAAGILATTITNYAGYYNTPLGSNYVSSGTSYGVTIGAGGGVGSYAPSLPVGSPGSNGGDTVIYNTTNPSYYYSTYFSNSYITATNAAFSFGTGDFTIETWLYPTSSYGKQTTVYSNRPIFNSRNFVNPDVADRGFLVYLDYANKVTIYTSGTTYINTVNTVTNGVWSHVAVSRNNGVLNVWINGVKDRITFLTTASTTYSNFTNTNIMIGYGSLNIDLINANFFTGYFSNYRIVKGVSAYNPGVQSLTAPLTATQSANVKGTPSVAISGTSTSLLMLTTSTTGIFYDSSLGTTSTLTTSTTTSYSSGLGPGTYSGSLSFNGTNQYLSSATSTAFTFGTGDFTVEYWVYYNALTAGTTYCLIGSGRSPSGYFFGSFGLIPYMSTQVVGYQVTPGATFKLQQWTHVAWVRNTAVAPGVNFYMNGSWAGYLQPNPGPTPDNITETGFSIGARSDPAYYSNAYVSNIRVVKGLAVYTSTGNFTPPTTITSATQSTSTDFTINAVTTQTVLLTFNSATIVDLSTLSNVLTQTSGTVSISTFAPFTTSTILIRAFGGGGGGAPYQSNGQLGGSGGGAPGAGFGGAAIPGQGNRGGQGSVSLASGGGGFGYPGGPASGDQSPWPVFVNGQQPAGYGGAGGYFNHSGAMVAYSGGGGGGSWNSTSYGVGLGGVGGGGNGAYYNLSSVLIPAVAGTTNSGGGGGGGNVTFLNAAAGGSGIVIFRYPAFLGDAARNPTDLIDTNLKNTTLLLSSNRTPTLLSPVYSTTGTASSFSVDYLIVGGGGGGGGSTSTVTGGSGGGGAGGVVSAVGYTPSGNFNNLFYADSAYANGLAVYPTTVGGWVNVGTDFASSSAVGYNWQYDNRGFSTIIAAKTTPLSEATKYYFEIYCGATVLGPYSNQTGNRALLVGLLRNSQSYTTGWTGMYLLNGYVQVNDVQTGTATAAYVAGDILNIAYDPINNKQWFGRNGVWQTGGVPGVDPGWNISGTGSIVLGFCNESSSSASMQGVIRKSSANTYTAPSGFVPYTYGYTLNSSTWTITVGSGGNGGTSGTIPTSGSSGANSSISFSNTNFIAYGGGGGGAAILSTSTIGSLYFNGTSNYLKITNSVSFFSAFGNLGTGSKTIEFWTYYIASGAGDVAYTYDKYNIFGNWVAAAGNGRFALGINNFDKFSFTYTTATSAASVAYTNASVPKGTWTHIAFVCAGTSAITIYINGVGETLTVDLSSHVGASAVVNDTSVWYNIGGQNQTGAGGTYTGYYNGYITNFRIVNGVAVYTGNFNVPAGPLTLTQSANPFGGSNTQAIPSGTQLLLSVNSATSYITDSSINNFSIGNATGVTYYYYAPLTLLSNYQGGSGASGGGGSYNVGGFVTINGQGNVGAPTSSMVLASGASLSFNGSSQYLSATKTGGWLSSDHTVEAWIYLTAFASPGCIAGESNGSNLDAWEWTVSSSVISIGYRLSGSITSVSSSTSLSLSTWYHVAFSRSGTTVKLFVNGSQVSSGTITGWTSQNILSIGYLESSFPYFFNGYISNFRIVNGVAVYTGNFNVPTRVLTITQTANPYGGSNVQAISTASYTSLLLTSSSITDLSSYNATITNNGSVVTTSSYPPINLFTYPGGGGGGAGSAGSWTATTSTGGAGGAGTYTSILSAAVATSAGVGQVINSLAYFGGGGAGGASGSQTLLGTGGNGGGGGSGASVNGTRYTGGGGAGYGASTGTGIFNYYLGTIQSGSGGARSTPLRDSGSYYFEVVYTGPVSGVTLFGLVRDTSGGGYNNVPSIFALDGAGYGGMTGGSAIGGFAIGDIINVAYNALTNKVWIGRNGTWYLDPVSTAGSTIPGTGNLRFIVMNGTTGFGSMSGIFRNYIYNTYPTPAGFITSIGSAIAADATYNNNGWVSATTDYNIGFSPSGDGGSGVVVIRYPNSQPDATIAPNSSAIYINASGYKNYIFTATGTITFASSATYLTQNYISGYVSGTLINNNRTIVDTSYNNIVVNTATTTLAQGTFSPYGSMWSTSFNGSTDYTSFVSTVTTGTAFQQNIFWGANKSFTIEAWLNPNNTQLSSTATVILGDVQPTSAGLAWSVGLDSSNKPMMYWKDSVNGNNFLTATNTLSTGTWNHVAWVSNAGTATIFINGVNQYLTSSTISTLTNTTQTYGIVSGAYFNKFYNGSISNLRVSTSPLYFPNLSLASSGYFNGSSYITSATSTAMTFGTNNFTVEFWVFWVTVGGAGVYNQVIGKPASAAGVGFGAGSGRWYMTTNTVGYDSGIAINTGQWYHVAWVRNGTTLTLYLNGAASGYAPVFTTSITDTGFDIGGSSLSAVQSSTVYVSNIRVLNGTALYTTAPFTVPTPNLTNITNTTLLTFLTTSTTFTNYASPPSTIAIGGGTPSFVGLTPIPVAIFTPPAAPFNAPTNTILLTNNTYRYVDSSTSSFAISTGTTTSVPKIQKSSPFSMGYAYSPLTIGGSASFNGYSDYIYTTTATDAAFISTATSLQFDSDFTIECWIYTTSTAVAQTIFDTAGKDGNTLRPNAFSLNMTTSGQLYFNYNNVTSASSIIPVNPFTWAHIAVTRYSGIMQIWQNGVQTFGINTTTNYSTGQMLIGRNGPTAASYFSGFITDFRVVKGQAIYTNTFNPPVAPLTLIDATTATGLLLNFNSVAIADATMNHNVIVTNSATISSSVTKYNLRSIYFPGVAEYLTIVPNSTSSYALGTGDFTVEMWFYVLPQTGWIGVNNLQPATVRTIFDMRTQNTANAGFDIYLGNTGTINVSTLGFGYITGTTYISVNTWHHIALTKQSSAHNLYLNGIPEGQTYTNTLTNFINPTVRIGYGVSAGFFNGYIDDVRITRGFARYAYPGFLVPQKSLPVK